MKKIGCVIMALGDGYKYLGEIASKSFMHFHQSEVSLHFITDSNKHKYKVELDKFADHGMGILKYAISYSIMKENNYDKIIILGADTITLARLDEFINNDEDILVSKDFRYRLVQDGNVLSDFDTHYNSDVAAFNNPQALLNVIKASIKFGNKLSKAQDKYAEQGGLNFVCNISKQHTHLEVEHECYYNVRAKGLNNSSLPDKMTNDFYVADGKVYASDGKQVKVWHYCYALSVQPNANQVFVEINRKLGKDVLEFVNKTIGIVLPVSVEELNVQLSSNPN
jgi:hypothetical protein